MKREKDTNTETRRLPVPFQLTVWLLHELAEDSGIDFWITKNPTNGKKEVCLRGSREDIRDLLNAAWPAIEMLHVVGLDVLATAIKIAGGTPSDELLECIEGIRREVGLQTKKNADPANHSSDRESIPRWDPRKYFAN